MTTTSTSANTTLTGNEQETAEQVIHTSLPWHVKAIGRGLYIESESEFVCDVQLDACTTDAERARAKANAELIVHRVNNFEALVDVLSLFKAMNNCNYDLETMRRSGLFEQVDAALIAAKGVSQP